MVEADVIIAKVASLTSCLARIRELRTRRDKLQQRDYRELLELNLQRATQDTIDIAAHVVATERWGVVDEVSKNFTILRERGLIAEDLEIRLRKMVGFRNVAVHQYLDLNFEIVEYVTEHRLDDLRDLAAAVVEHFNLGG